MMSAVLQYVMYANLYDVCLPMMSAFLYYVFLPV